MAILSRQAVLPAARKGGRAVCLWMMVAVIAPVQAGNFLNLSQVPPGAGFKGPAPNVIISVDDSGSMGTVGMEALRTALQETFRPENVPDGSIRLAYQSMTLCNSIPSASPGCDNFNYMQPLVGNYDPAENSARGRFLRWVSTLTSTDSTPTLTMMRNAGEYLRTTGTHSPWNAEPGKADNSPLSCRKAYHVLMTDGGWNSFADVPTVDGDSSKREIYNNTIDNIDGTYRVLPDGKVYDPAASESKVYADPWGRQATDGGGLGLFWQGDNGVSYGSQSNCTKNTKNCKQVNDLDWRDVGPSLSDLAFFYWASDLQPGIANHVPATMRQESDETVAADQRSQVLTPYWNPRNDPATWQHMVNYTIGYNAAASWPVIADDPVFGTHTFDGDYPRLVVGTRKWQNAVQPPTPVDSSGALPIYYLNHGYTTLYPYGTEQEAVRQQEMWHAALNSRGKFVPAPTPADLVKAFKELVTGIVEDNQRAIANYASASSIISTTDTTAYASFYEASGWRGGVQSYQVAQSTGALSANAAWGSTLGRQGLSSADLLDALDADGVAARLVLASNGSQGISLEFNNLSAAQKSWLNRSSAASTTTDQLGAQRVQFLRGDRSLEGSSFRTRRSRQGDIVNSAIWYIAAPAQGYGLPGYTRFANQHINRTPMLYVGGNDGMLHGFSATTGVEKLAYVPLGVMQYLPNLSSPGYSHRYYVDGSPFTGDVYVNPSASQTEDRWRTLLVSSLGAGGKGYFVLDVTQPGHTPVTGFTTGIASNFAASNFAASNASRLVVLDATDGSDADIGYITAEPVVNEYNSQISSQITQLNNGRWAVVLGNGANSSSERAVLLIQYLDGDRALLKLTAASTGTEATANGLSAPRLVDVNGDGIPDVAYAGDLRGNLWKFMLTSSDSTQWGVAFQGAPLFTAAFPSSSGSSKRQPITTAPLVRVNNTVGGLMVAFGTGRNLTDTDAADVAGQSFYAILDSTRYAVNATGSDAGKLRVADSTDTTAPVAARTALVARSFNSTAVQGTQASAGTQFWSMGTATVLNYAAGAKGWYLDLPASGERVIRSPRFYSPGSNLVEILSDRPGSNGAGNEERCEPTTLNALAWRTVLGIEMGLAPNQQLLDTNGDGIYSATADQSTNRMTTSPKTITFRTKGERVHVGADGSDRTNELARPFTSLNWRQLQ